MISWGFAGPHPIGVARRDQPVEAWPPDGRDARDVPGTRDLGVGRSESWRCGARCWRSLRQMPDSAAWTSRPSPSVRKLSTPTWKASVWLWRDTALRNGPPRSPPSRPTPGARCAVGADLELAGAGHEAETRQGFRYLAPSEAGILKGGPERFGAEATMEPADGTPQCDGEQKPRISARRQEFAKPDRPVVWLHHQESPPRAKHTPTLRSGRRQGPA